MKRRKLIIDGFDTAEHGHMTLSAFSAPAPKCRSELQVVPGMDGALDYSEAVIGRPQYDTRTITATLECSYGTYQERQKVFDALINRVNGRRVKIVPPDYPDHYYMGRVYLSQSFHKPTYGVLTLEAVCDPWRYSAVPNVLLCPVLRAENIVFTEENTSFCSELSSTEDASFSVPTTATHGIVSLWAGEFGRYGVWKLQLEPNTDYYTSARPGDRGTWGIAVSPNAEEWVRGAIRTGAEGVLYLKLQAYTAKRFDLKPFLIVKAVDVPIAQNGKAPATAMLDLRFTDLGTRSIAVAVGENVSVYSCSEMQQIDLPPGDVPLMFYYWWEVDGIETVPVHWTRGDL